MQIANSYSKGGFPPSGGGSPVDIDSQLRQQQASHKRVLMLRSVGYWWLPAFLTLLGVAAAITVAQLVGITYPLPVFAVMLGIPVLVFMINRVDFSLLLLVIFTTAISRSLVTIKGASIYPSQVIMLILFCTLLVQAAFHAHKIVLPPFRMIWPQFGLFGLGIVANIIVQFTWSRGVPHKINSNPIIYDELLGTVGFLFPLVVYVIVTMILSERERYIRYIPRIFTILAVVVSTVVLYDFRRIGGDIYTFRFSEPHIFWMSLRAIAQLLALGSILAYARFLYATNWPQRFLYLFITILCLATVILTLENSWWFEAFLGLTVMTIMYSWRLMVFYIGLLIPFTPLLKAEYTKLQTVKSADTNRFIIWQDALRVWHKQPILGVGPGNFWAYDQVFTNLPRALRNCNVTGLCVAHNGYLQILGEEGPIGLFLFLAFPVLIIIFAALLYRRAYIPKRHIKGNPFFTVAKVIGLDLPALPEPAAGKSKNAVSPYFQFKVRHLLMVLSPLWIWNATFGNAKNFWLQLWAVFADDARSERHVDRMLAMSAIGLTVGSMAADFFAGGFFLPPRQISIFSEMPQVVTSWIIWGMVMYRDQQWRKKCKQAAAAGTTPVAYADEYVG